MVKNLLITDRKYTGSDSLIPKIIASIKLKQVNYIQIREKDLADSELLPFCKEIKSTIKPLYPEVKILINSRVDIAKDLDLDGVHFPENVLDDSNLIDTARQTLGQNKIIGVSTHSLKNAIFAEKLGADYITFSPIFYTESKKEYGVPQGLDKLKECADAVNIPVIALGGINESNISACLKAGASGIAAIKYFLGDS